MMLDDLFLDCIHEPYGYSVCCMQLCLFPVEKVIFRMKPASRCGSHIMRSFISIESFYELSECFISQTYLGQLLNDAPIILLGSEVLVALDAFLNICICLDALQHNACNFQLVLSLQHQCE